MFHALIPILAPLGSKIFDVVIDKTPSLLERLNKPRPPSVDSRVAELERVVHSLGEIQVQQSEYLKKALRVLELRVNIAFWLAIVGAVLGVSFLVVRAFKL